MRIVCHLIVKKTCIPASVWRLAFCEISGAFQPATVTTNMEGLPEFYELHLIILSVICLLSLLADRYSKKNRRLRDVVDERQGSSSLATLTRQYLVVYGIVMGSSPYYYYSLIVGSLTGFCRGWLATRPICIFFVSRTVQLSREASCNSLCYWFCLCRTGSSFGWRMGGSTVKL